MAGMIERLRLVRQLPDRYIFDVPDEFVTVYCFLRPSGYYLCTGWERWGSYAPARPSEDTRRAAEMLANGDQMRRVA